jgi:hypothetical protein
MRSFSFGRGSAVFAAALFCIAMLHPDRAATEGALAVGLPKNVAKEGFAYAYSTGKTDTKTARSEALTTCRKPGDNKSAQARAICSVVGTFVNQCVAVAMDPAAGTPGVGWAIAGDLKSAESGAIAQCQKTAGDDRSKFCVVDHSRCDGTAN